MILFASTSAFVAFLGIAAFGFVFLLGSSLLGGLTGHGGFRHKGDGHGSAPGILSSRVLSVFIAAFGSFGAIGIRFGYGVGASTAMGFGGGLLFAGVIYLFANFLYSQQASSHIRTGALVGNTAQVSVAIPKGGVGQVRCTLGDTVVEKTARAAGDEDIPVYSLVKIQNVVGDVVLVKRAE